MANATTIPIVGYACRLPGAGDSNSLWALLKERRSAIGKIEPERFPTAPYFHPDGGEAGKSYSFAAGTIEDPWGFDAAAFGISPREAIQIDPQQRHLLETAFDALGHAGIRPSSLAGSRTGVYVGASSLDYGARFMMDPAAADVHMMTGNTLSLIANRISHVLGIHGPSLAVDTACSSSLVALSLAAEAINRGEIDTAIVGAVNLLLSPFSFVGFSRASMLSRTGQCRPFDADADGYVRSEGAVVFVLRSQATAKIGHNRVHAEIVGWGVGQDGRTTGVSLPSAEAQQGLLRRTYDLFSLDPRNLAFVEAHGTGTPTGDPIEADALGKALGWARRRPLSIGSIKSNIGHLEPAAGLAGALKAVLALERGELPASINFATANPNIPFEDLNLRVVTSEIPMPTDGRVLAGVNSFGFGGTIAHVVLQRPEPARASGVLTAGPLPPLLLSAHSAPALDDLIQAYIRKWPNDDVEIRSWIDASAYCRDALGHRLVVEGFDEAEIRTALQKHASGGQSDAVSSGDKTLAIRGEALGTELPVCFVFSGNGSQWAGMGRAAWDKDLAFRVAFEEIDARFGELTGRQPCKDLFATDLGQRLRRATASQPLLFAIQYAIVQALAEKGLEPTAALGHSVGEIAAAWATGALSLDDAIRVVHARSTHQERARGSGSMIAVLTSAEDANAALKRSGLVGLEVAAINSPRSITLSGPESQLEEFMMIAEAQRWSAVRLDLDYPFHSGLVDPVREPLLQDLTELQPRPASLTLYSTVTGKKAKGEELDAQHWWHNVRQPVAFSAAARAAIDAGHRLFVEIGPKPILGGYLRDNLRECGVRGITIESLTEKHDEESANPIAATVAKAFVSGAHIDFERLFGPVRGPSIILPAYPWQHRQFKIEPTAEATTVFTEPLSPLLGVRPRADADVWFGKIDTATQPWLADHRVGETVLFPAAAFAAVMLAAAKDLFATNDIEVRDLDIFQPLTLANDQSVETMTRVGRESGVAEFLSRPRLTEADWTLHAKATLARRHVEENHDAAPSAPVPELGPDDAILGQELYERAANAGFNYGPCFRRVVRAKLQGATCVELILAPLAPKLTSQGFVLDPTALDASMHGLLAFDASAGALPKEARFLPVRFGRIRLLAAGAVIARARLILVKRTERSATVDIDLRDGQGTLVAEVRGLRFTAAPADDLESNGGLVYRMRCVRLDRSGEPSPLSVTAAVANGASPVQSGVAAGQALLEMACLRTAWDSLGAGAQAVAVGEDEEGESGAHFVRAAVLWALEARGLAATRDGHDLAAAALCDLPPLPDTIRRLVNEHPTFGLEAACVTHIGNILPRLLSSMQGTPRRAASAVMARQLATGSTVLSELRTQAAAILRAVIEGGKDRVLRVLCVGADHADLMSHLAREVDGLEVVVTDDDEHRLGEAEAGWGPVATGIAWRSLASLAEYETGRFDLAVAVDSLYRIAPRRGNLERLQRVLRPNAPVLVAELAPSLFWDLMRGESEAWWQRTASAKFPVSALLSAEDWKLELTDAGFDDVEIMGSGVDATIGTILTARYAASSPDTVPSTPSKPQFALGGIRDAFADLLLATMMSNNRIDDASRDAERDVLDGAEPPSSGPLEQLWYAPLDVGEENATKALSTLLDLLAATLQSEATSKTRLWVIARPARCHRTWSPASDPMWCALQGALRVARNEYPDREIFCIALDPELSAEEAARALSRELTSDADDVEIVLARDARRVFRVHRGPTSVDLPGVSADSTGIRLERPASGAPIWREFTRPEPGPNEVEIEVEATGLNFRDVMWSLGLLPEEALDGGYAGATLGMECAGRIARVGSAIADLQVGDRVVALAPAAFATHALAPRSAVLALPDAIPADAAAALPVAFLTAWYALLHLGNLAAGESILIHGAAGGVGLAALQIARRSGAKIFATAGTPAKRALLTALGADHVLDSRNIRFASQVMEITGQRGVDVVLNSLAGEAMVQSLECLAPFGRFLEIGKRDFYLNSRIGLRPFRDNVSYHAIDIDRLINRDATLAQRILQGVLKLLASGELKSLPYRTFEGACSDEAFRVMQRSQHIGKIVIQPPRRAQQTATAATRFAADPHGLHVVAGGLGGFGLATVRWLASRGARHFLLIGRHARITEEHRRTIEELEAAGIDIDVQAADITERETLASCLGTAGMRRPIKGVVHAAMVLDDRLIASLDRGAIEKVLAPKVTGALNLDRATQDMPLDYFLMFASATSLIGNPGQYNYVSANAFLEGLVQRRRDAGLPATAVAWGAIGDVGYLARHAGRSKALRRRLGAHVLTAQEALDQLDALLAPDAAATAIVARIDWRQARRELATVRTPTFGFVASGSGMELPGVGSDALANLKNLSADEREGVLSALVRAEIGRALRLPASEVSLTTPLADIGMDSLMMLELRTTMEAQLAVELPMMALANGLTPMDVVRRLNPLFGSSSEPIVQRLGAVRSLAESHIDSERLASETYIRSAREVARRSSGGDRKL
jgi:phthiocerol/phenolphthiocerol synthesis type-I polyketide synthase C